jgi:hypothetical protein
MHDTEGGTSHVFLQESTANVSGTTQSQNAELNYMIIDFSHKLFSGLYQNIILYINFIVLWKELSQCNTVLCITRRTL